MDTDTALAWAAGLFEGEGYIGFYPYTSKIGVERGYHMRILVLGMTDEDVVRRFHAIVGVGKVTPRPPSKKGWSPYWRWEAGARTDIEPLLHAFLPYFGERRRAKALLLLANPARPLKGWQHKACKRGHAFTDDNIYIDPRGARICKTCRARRHREYKARKRAAEQTS